MSLKWPKKKGQKNASFGPNCSEKHCFYGSQRYHITSRRRRRRIFLPFFGHPKIFLKSPENLVGFVQKCPENLVENLYSKFVHTTFVRLQIPPPCRCSTCCVGTNWYLFLFKNIPECSKSCNIRCQCFLY